MLRQITGAAVRILLVVLVGWAALGSGAAPAQASGCPAYTAGGATVLDTGAAYDYACAHANADADDYYTYANDSANFASQLLHAAGEHESSGYYWNQAGAWGTDNRTPGTSAPPLHSNSWASPPDLYRFLIGSGIGTALPAGGNTLADTQAGDLIFWDWNTVAGTYDDVSMVVSGSGADPAHELVASHIPDSGSGPLDSSVARVPGLEPMNLLMSIDIGAFLHSVAGIDAAKYGTSGSCPSSDSGSGGASGSCWSWHVVRLNTTTPPAGPHQKGETTGGWNPSEPACQVCKGDPVNTATGELDEQVNDTSLPGRGPQLSLTRSYASRVASTDGRFGYGWTDDYAMSIAVDADDPDTMDVNQENGSIVRFVRQSDGSWAAPGRVLATLAKGADGSWTFTRQKASIFRFDASGRLTAETNRNGETTTLGYVSGKLVSVTDAGGRRLILTYTGSHVRRIMDSASRYLGYRYDAAGNLIGATDLDGNETLYGYDVGHHLTSITTPGGGTTTNVFDGDGRVSSQTDPNGHTTTWDYAIDGTVSGTTTITDPEGHVTKDVYSNGDLMTETEAYGTPLAATTTYEYDHATNSQTVVTDPNGHTTRRTFDGDGNRLSETNPLGRTTTWTYDGYDEVTSVTPPATYGGRTVTTTYRYDEPAYSSGGGSNLTTVSTPILSATGVDEGTQVTHYLHATAAHPGDVTSMIDPQGSTWTYGYDTVGDKTSETAPATTDNSDGTGPRRNLTRWHYSIYTGWLTSKLEGRYTLAHPTETLCITLAAGCTTYTHDASGRVLVTTDGDGHQTTQQYDTNGNLDSSVDANGNETDFAYDANDQRITTTRPDATTLRTSYWPNGEVKDQIDGAGATQHYTYDALDHVASVTDPDDRTTTYQHDLVGNIVAQGDPGVSGCTLTSTMDGCTTYGYDAADQQTTVNYHDAGTHDLVLRYDADGRSASTTDGTGTSVRRYDSLGRTTQDGDGDGATTSYGYDAAANVTSIEYPGGRGTVTRGFDPAGRIDAIGDWNGRTTRFAYDANSSLTKKTAPPSAGLTDVNASFGTAGTADGQLNGATGTAVDGSGNVWVADSNNNRVEQFSSTGTFLRSVGTYGTGSGNLSYPLGVAVNKDAGNVYVADYSNDRIQEFTTSGNVVRSFGTSGTGDGQLSGPYGLAVDDDGNVWVADTWNNRIQEFTADGTFVRAFGSWGTGDGQMEGPKAITVFGGHVYVADTTNNRIERFSTAGVFEMAFGTTGSGDGQFNGPEGLAGDRHNGQLYVTDTGNGRIEAFSPDGHVVRAFGSSGSGNGHLSSPKGIAFSTAGDAYVTDQGNNRITRWNEDAPVVDTTAYDWADQVASVSVDKGAASLGAFNYGRDNAGLVASVASSGVPSDNHSYTHNTLAQLSAQDGSGLSYDAADRPTQLVDGTSLTYDPAGQLTGAAKGADHTTFGYDAKGQRTSGKVPGAAASTSYSYDQVGELTQTQTGSVTATYTYGSGGLRASKTVGATTQTFRWDKVTSSTPRLLVDGSTSYVYGPDGAPLEQLEADGTALTFHHDQQDSTRLLTDVAGIVVGTASYDVLGGHPVVTGKTSHLGYGGEYTDAETGLLYLRARYYDPATAQFLTPDPASAATGQIYQYANGDPLDFADPAGLCSIGQRLKQALEQGVSKAAGLAARAAGGLAAGYKIVRQAPPPPFLSVATKVGRLNPLAAGALFGGVSQPVFDLLSGQNLTLTARIGRTAMSAGAGAAGATVGTAFVTACTVGSWGVAAPVCAGFGITLGAGTSWTARKLLSPVSKALGWGGL